MLQLNDEIVPGISAAGIALGSNIETVLRKVEPKSITELNGCIRYDFGEICLWESGGVIDQIGLVLGYTGKLSKKIGVGSTLKELENEFGEISEDEDDNLIVEGLLGVCFESDAFKNMGGVDKSDSSKIIGIYVFIRKP
jgi:hypothetical protein